MLKLVNDLRKQRLKYFKDAWNLLEFVMLAFSITSIAMYAMKKIFGTVAIDVLRDSDSGSLPVFFS